jgi:hypothetical protein
MLKTSTASSFQNGKFSKRNPGHPRPRFSPQDPCATVDEIAALGLRHVGYAVPVELFDPFVEGGIITDHL